MITALRSNWIEDLQKQNPTMSFTLIQKNTFDD